MDLATRDTQRSSVSKRWGGRKGSLSLHSEFEASLGDMRPCFYLKQEGGVSKELSEVGA